MVKTPQQSKPLLPPLENGDRLSRYEFERRYRAMPHLKKAELIEGVVYMAAALRFRSHAEPHSHLLLWLGSYKVGTAGLALGDTPTVRLDTDNEPQPDAVLLIEEEAGGQSRISADDYIEGAPELVAEIAASSAAIDLGDKKRVYRRNGVKEYIVWQVFDQKVDWFYLQDGEYLALPIDPDSVIRSRVFPGLWLAVDDLLAGNMSRVLAVLQEGIASPEHAAFLQQLDR
ncbi:MAG: Uma2 family endonuclease [Thermosynechococcaceae cyanobacterium MS004]|nr:Uma2 family endonuclease [Thermosynechococcaceae cyanobacterium MS004]